LQGPVRVTDRLDHLDAERFRDMMASAPFQLLRTRIEMELGRALAICEGQDDIRLLRRAQGQAAALRCVLGLPIQILSEIERKK
jgi:hypothetical protein